MQLAQNCTYWNLFVLDDIMLLQDFLTLLWLNFVMKCVGFEFLNQFYNVVSPIQNNSFFRKAYRI